MEIAAVAAFVGVVVCAVLMIVFYMKDGPWKISIIGMGVCFIAVVVLSILSYRSLNDTGTADGEPEPTGMESQKPGESEPGETDEPGESGEPQSGESQGPIQESTEPVKNGGGSIADQLGITEYSYKSMISRYYFMVVQNNSSENADISVNVTFYDADGELVGAQSRSQEALESGYSAVLSFMPDEDYSSVKYEIDAKKESWFECARSDLSYTVTEAKNKVILSVTNNGNKPADFVEAVVLFFNGTDLVGHSRNYTTDNDAELKPGKTISKEMDCYEAFDSYQVFLTGRR